MSPAERKALVSALLAATPDHPVYGTAEWLALDPGHPGFLAGAVRAAECWQSDLEDTLERYRDEWRAGMAEKRAADAEYVRGIASHREEWALKSWRPHPTNRVDVGWSDEEVA